MSTRPSTGTGGVSPNVHLNITAAPPQYVWFKNERYLVQAFQRNPTGGDLDITNSRDWTQAGLAAMEAADKVFTAQGKNFAEAKTVQVPLTGELSISETATTDATQIRIGNQIKFARTVTNAPTESITIRPEDQPTIQQEITRIGQETATWKAVPTSTSQRPQQQGAATSQRTDTTASPSSPQTPPDASTTTPLPQLSFTAPSLYTHNEQDSFDGFLRNRAGALSATQANPAATISLQIGALTPAIVKTEAELLQELTQYVQTDALNQDNPYKFEPSDIEEIFTFLATRFANDSRALNLGLDAGEDTQLQRILQNSQAPSTEADKKILLKAFGLFCQINHGAETDRPQAFFKAMHAILNREPKNVVMRQFARSTYDYSTDPSTQKQIVLVSEQDGKYKIDQRWPATGAIDPSKTLFILKAVGGYQGFNRTALNSITQNPLLPPQSQTTTRVRPAYLTTDLHYDAGGGGDCGAKAIAAAILEKDGTYYEHQYAWRSAVNDKSAAIRRETMQYMYAHPEEFLEDSRFDQFTNAYKEDGARGIKQHLRAGPIRSKLEELLAREKTALSPDDKKWMVQLYATIASQEGVWLDKPFFLGYAVKYNQPVAMILNYARATGVPETLVYAPSQRLINKDEFLFVSYNGSDHFQPMYRSHTDLQGFIDRSNTEKQNIVSRHEFLETLQTISSSTATVISPSDTLKLQQKLTQLKTNDPHAYLTLRSLVAEDVFTRLENGTDIAGFLDALPHGLVVAEAAAGLENQSSKSISARLTARINSHTDLQARANFFKTLAEAKNASNPGPIPVLLNQNLKEALDNLKTDDTEGYLALRKILLDQDPTHDIVTVLGVHNMPQITPWLLDIDLGVDNTVGNMLAKGAKDLQVVLTTPENQGIPSLAAFLKDPKQVTYGNILRNDPNTYFCIREALLIDQHSGITRENIKTNPHLLILYIKQHTNDAEIVARAELVKTLQSSDHSELEDKLQALQDDDPLGYLALETFINKGALTPSDLKDEIEALIADGAQIQKIIEKFPTLINSKQNVARYNYFQALENARRNPSEVSNLQTELDQLTEHDLYALLAIMDAVNEKKKFDEDATVHDFTISQLKHEISLRPYMQYRAQFQYALVDAQEEDSIPAAKQKLSDAISEMQKHDIQGWLALVQMTKKTSPAEIMQELLDKSELSQQFTENTQSSEMMTRGEFLRTVYDKHSTAEIINGKISGLLMGDRHGALVLGSIIYKNHPPSPLPSPEPTTPAEKAQLGLGIMRDNPLFLKEINSLEFAQKLLTTHINDESDRTILVESPATE
ncbi:MAG: hypothetical protein JSR57_09700 [Verrucomicrobia bacterium]|nr:hypothetical protein [Verrucomicrobiota bacterium]